ncbi:MAG: hypothetical protein A2Z14_14105 [Chloroflexi bacterium RBG_16_48_8]|nr:MAG: hypothetical protein A2Z14_14105 [Chloroflexi bacterium RBG_16_48_8]
MNSDVRGNLYLGTQGFTFDDWVGPFYPVGTPKKTYLEEYTKHFPTVEIDSTFYGVPKGTTIQSWKERTPEEFLFAAKFPRLITHDKKLDGAQGDAEYFVSTMQALERKLAVLTLQFAYDFTPEFFDRLDDFLRTLPQGPRYAVEVRNRQWLNPNFGEMLSNHNVALVLQDLNYMPKMDWITADFTVIRWLGRRKDIQKFDHIQIDRTDVLQSWAEKVHLFLEQGFDVYGYFNNHFAGHSPASVRQFAEIMGVEIKPAGGAQNTSTQLSLDVGNE